MNRTFICAKKQEKSQKKVSPLNKVIDELQFYLILNDWSFVFSMKTNRYEYFNNLQVFPLSKETKLGSMFWLGLGGLNIWEQSRLRSRISWLLKCPFWKGQDFLNFRDVVFQVIGIMNWDWDRVKNQDFRASKVSRYHFWIGQTFLSCEDVVALKLLKIYQLLKCHF